MRQFFLPIALLIILAGLVLFKTVPFFINGEGSKNPVELAVAKEHDGTDRFYRQVIENNGEWIANAGSPIFDNQYLAIIPPKLADGDSSAVLGSHIATDGSEKRIDVSLSEQKLRAYEGSRLIYEFPISSGRPGYETIKGEFRIWRKVRNQTYRGGSKARGDYYYLPNVPYSVFFHEGYAIHGAYWHNDFGIKRRSSGCVNLSIPNAEKVYNWAGPAMSSGAGALNSTPDNPGVRVVVHN